MTFRPHPDPEGLLVSHGGWDDGNGGIERPEDSRNKSGSGRTPLQGQTFKKKIKFADYKNRDKTKSIGKDAATAQTVTIDSGAAKEKNHRTFVESKEIKPDERTTKAPEDTKAVSDAKDGPGSKTEPISEK